MRLYRLLPILLSAVLLGPSAQAMTPGDINNDGQFNVLDAILALRIAAQVDTPTAEQLRAGDVSPVVPPGLYGDGAVNISDAIRLLRRAAGLEPAGAFPGSRYYTDPPAPGGTVPMPFYTTQAVHGDTTRDLTFEGAFTLRGKVNGVTAEQQGYVLFKDPSTRAGVGVGLAADGTYAVAVPGGRYQVSLTRTLAPANGATDTLYLTVPFTETVSVAGDDSPTLTAPELPALVPVHGRVTVPAGTPAPYYLQLRMMGNTPETPVPFGINAGSVMTLTGAEYSTRLPVGAYYALLSTSGVDSYALPVDEVRRVDGETTWDVTGNPLSLLSGSATPGPGVTFPDSQTSLRATPAIRPVIPTGSTRAPLMNGHYQMRLRDGAYTFVLGFTVVDATRRESWTWNLPDVTVAGETVRDVQGPALPSARVQLHGHLTGPNGVPVTHGYIIATSTALDDAPAGLNVGFLTNMLPSGDYSISVPRGQYDLTVYPQNPVDTSFNPASLPPATG